MTISKPIYLINSGWRHEAGEWFDPSGNWPDGMTVDQAAHVQWMREYQAANGIDALPEEDACTTIPKP